jgi:hypothetical protein
MLALPAEGTSMKIAILACAALAFTVPAAAPAQTVNEDVRCLLVSTGFSRQTKDENVRRASAMAASFYLGRLNGRLAPPALTAAIRAQGKGLPARQAGEVMRACAMRAAAAEQQLATASKQAGLAK